MFHVLRRRPIAPTPSLQRVMALNDYEYADPYYNYFDNPNVDYIPSDHESVPPFDTNHQRLPVRLPFQVSSHISREELLILPSNLTHLTALIQYPGLYQSLGSVVHATVAGNLRLRDIVQQLWYGINEYDVRVHVKNRGSWMQSSLDTRINDVRGLGYGSARNENGDVELKIEVRRRRGIAHGGVDRGFGMTGRRRRTGY